MYKLLIVKLKFTSSNSCVLSFPLYHKSKIENSFSKNIFSIDSGFSCKANIKFFSPPSNGSKLKILKFHKVN